VAVLAACWSSAAKTMPICQILQRRSRVLYVAHMANSLLKRTASGL